MSFIPRVALFTDCYYETNGVANAIRRLVAFAREQDRPMLCVRHGDRPGLGLAGTVTTFELARSPLRIPVDMDLAFDILFARHFGALVREVKQFRPDVIHVTGPGDCGILGVLIARALRIPLVASWHTNIHEFGAKRLDQALGWMPASARLPLCQAAGRAMLRLLGLYYRIPRVILAPNPELAAMLEELTRRPVHMMVRGVDSQLFRPERRQRLDSDLVFGYVGRLTPEKNVRLLAGIARALNQAGATGYRFTVVGDGGERAPLMEAMPGATFTGILKGEALADAYASMDVLLFPSRTDTFGNVALEAQASGVPVLVTSSGGPKFIVSHERTGWIAESDEDFVGTAVSIAANRASLPAMRIAARNAALQRSWPHVFSNLYETYRAALDASGVAIRDAVPTAG